MSVAVNAPPVTPAAMQDEAQYLTFMVGGETFALDILGIKEIIEYDELTHVPMMPACIRGVINLRGAVVPVLDLAVRFGRAAAPVSRRTCIILVELLVAGERHDMGVIVDAVHAVVEIPASEIEPAPAFGPKIRTDFIAGMGKLGGKFVIVLDAAQVLSPDEIGALAGDLPVSDGGTDASQR